MPVFVCSYSYTFLSSAAAIIFEIKNSVVAAAPLSYMNMDEKYLPTMHEVSMWLRVDYFMFFTGLCPVHFLIGRISLNKNNRQCTKKGLEDAYIIWASDLLSHF